MLDALPPGWSLAYITFVGACLGSFVNVVIARLPAEESIVRPRSRCPGCKHPIAWYDNVPLVSWLVLRGRCRRCGMRIPVRYFVVELLMALLAGGLWLRFGWTFELLVWLPLTAALLAIVFLDIDHYWVPDVITLPGIAIVLAAAFLPDGMTPLGALIGIVPALCLWAFAWVFHKLTKREGMGLGDVKLLALIGVALGAVPALFVLFLGAAQGSVIGLLLMATGGHRAKDPDVVHDDGWRPHARAIPFGPFLVLACLEVVLLPDIFGDLPLLLMQLSVPT